MRENLLGTHFPSAPPFPLIPRCTPSFLRHEGEGERGGTIHRATIKFFAPQFPSLEGLGEGAPPSRAGRGDRGTRAGGGVSPWWQDVLINARGALMQDYGYYKQTMQQPCGGFAI
jgi:hypothetical protein